MIFELLSTSNNQKMLQENFVLAILVFFFTFTLLQSIINYFGVNGHEFWLS